MALSATKNFGRACAGVAIAGTLAAGMPGAFARGGSLFTMLAGYWSGSGLVTDNRGHKEDIRCKITYAVSGNGSALNQNLLCASASYRFNVASTIYDRDGAVTGQWTETSRGVSGQVSGKVSGNRIFTNVIGQGFSATLSVVTNGNSQSVSIRPQGADVQSISISLRRSG